MISLTVRVPGTACGSMLSESPVLSENPFEQGPPTAWTQKRVSSQDLTANGDQPSGDSDGRHKELILTRSEATAVK